ncbi:MAG: hypothetical protein KatS3mg034_0042 [Vicingaceae bacterium]|nr:MAG: hypothetical protein KatS3mg034_0042 [Vicingaceae bacterium]
MAKSRMTNIKQFRKFFYKSYVNLSILLILSVMTSCLLPSFIHHPLKAKNSYKKLTKYIWLSDMIVPADSTVKAFRLTVYDKNLHTSGYLNKFHKDGSFQSYFFAKCGNDIFTSLYGRYRINGKGQMIIFVDSILIKENNQLQDKYSTPEQHLFTWHICGDTLYMSTKKLP